MANWLVEQSALAVRERFHLDQWRASVERRLYSMVHSEVNERRMLWLEMTIVILFIIDVLALLLWK